MATKQADSKVKGTKQGGKAKEASKSTGVKQTGVKQTSVKSAGVKEKPGSKSVKAKKTESKPVGKGSSNGHVQTEVKWNPRRLAIVKAMKALNAISPEKARTAADIADKAGVVEDVDLSEHVNYVKICLDVYRKSELLATGYAASTRQEGERQLRYYLTPKGVAACKK